MTRAIGHLLNLSSDTVLTEQGSARIPITGPNAGKFIYHNGISEIIIDAIELGELAGTGAGEGASQIGVEDSAGNFTGTTVETVLSELFGLIGGGGNLKADVISTAVAPFTGGTTTYPHTLGVAPQVIISHATGSVGSTLIDVHFTISYFDKVGNTNYSSGLGKNNVNASVYQTLGAIQSGIGLLGGVSGGDWSAHINTGLTDANDFVVNYNAGSGNNPLQLRYVLLAW